VAVGGGSVIDCAKALGILCTNRKPVLEFEGVDKVPIPMPPIVCIPTTGGTSADVSQFAIVTNEYERVKIAIVSKSVVPDVALVDPRTLTTMTPMLTACTGVDALVHAIEAYVSNANSDLTDLHALEAIRLISKHLLATVKAGQDLDARRGVMLASLQAGLAFSNASLGAVHAMAHSLGGMLDLPHGECNAMLLPHVVQYNFQAAPERYVMIGRALGVDMANRSEAQARSALVSKILDLKHSVGIDATLASRGVSRTDVSALARKAMADPCIATNPRRPEQRDIEVIYEEAL
jgi:alcohol dehydrogenase class IV